MKTILAVVLLGCLALGAFAEHHGDHWEDEHKCTPLKKFKVHAQWVTAWGEGRHRLEFATKLWSSFFRLYPKARELFPNHIADNIYSPRWQAVSQGLLSTYAIAIDTADDPEALKVIVKGVKTRLAEKGIKDSDEFSDAFRDEFLHIVAEEIGIHFDYAAWKDCFDALNALFKSA